jgi:hypothetical protein
LEDDVRIAQQFKPLAEEEMDALRRRAEEIKGPSLEDWKRNIKDKARGSSVLHSASRLRHG